MSDISLVQLDPGRHLHTVYGYMMSDDQYLFNTRLVINTENDFAEWFRSALNDFFHDFFIVEHKGECIGFVYDYDFSLTDGRCEVTAFVEEGYRNTGAGSIAAVMFMKRLFGMYPLRKIYVSVYDYNEQSLASNQKAGFSLEGYLEKYRYNNGEHHGVYIMSMKRDVFYKTIGRLTT